MVLSSLLAVLQLHLWKLGVWLGCRVPTCFVCIRPRFKPQAFGKLKHCFYLWNISKVIIPVRMYILFCYLPLAFYNKIIPNAEMDTVSIWVSWNWTLFFHLISTDLLCSWCSDKCWEYRRWTDAVYPWGISEYTTEIVTMGTIIYIFIFLGYILNLEHCTMLSKQCSTPVLHPQSAQFLKCGHVFPRREYMLHSYIVSPSKYSKEGYLIKGKQTGTLMVM